jgi:hypothetical protein
MRVETIRPSGTTAWVVGLVGLQTEGFRSVTLTAQDLQNLKIQDAVCSYDGNGQLLRQAVRWF